MGDIAAVIGDAGVQEGETFFVRKQPSWSAAGWYLWVWACVVVGVSLCGACCGCHSASAQLQANRATPEVLAEQVCCLSGGSGVMRWAIRMWRNPRLSCACL